MAAADLLMSTSGSYECIYVRRNQLLHVPQYFWMALQTPLIAAIGSKFNRV